MSVSWSSFIWALRSVWGSKACMCAFAVSFSLYFSRMPQWPGIHFIYNLQPFLESCSASVLTSYFCSCCCIHIVVWPPWSLKMHWMVPWYSWTQRFSAPELVLIAQGNQINTHKQNLVWYPIITRREWGQRCAFLGRTCLNLISDIR